MDCRWKIRVPHFSKLGKNRFLLCVCTLLDNSDWLSMLIGSALPANKDLLEMGSFKAHLDDDAISRAEALEHTQWFRDAMSE